MRGKRTVRRGSVVRRKVVCTSSSDDDTVVNTNPPRRRVKVGVRAHQDYVGRRVSVPGSYFQMNGITVFEGRVGRWGRYKSTCSTGGYSCGHYIHYDEGDEWWMLESDVHKYVD